QKVDNYTDFSFLYPQYFDDFIEKVKKLSLSNEEIELLKEKREKEIDAKIIKLNNDIYKEEKGLSESDRVYLVASTIIATLGIPGKVAPLEYNDLNSLEEVNSRDGDILIRKIEAFLKTKNIAIDKQDLIIRTLKNTLFSENINKAEKGTSQLKR